MSRPAPAAAIVMAGATGHVGAALLRRLVDEGRRVRCIARDPTKLGSMLDAVELVQADLRDDAAVRAAF